VRESESGNRDYEWSAAKLKPNRNGGPNGSAKLRVAIVHYWFVSRRGGERVIDALCELFPNADLFALVADPGGLSPTMRKHKLTTSFLQKFPGSRRFHRHMLPLYPLAVEQFDLRGYDLVISQESGPAKGVLTDPETCHICYCHTPMRYIWDFYHEYKNGSGLGFTKKAIFGLTAHYARIWDQLSASRVDRFVAGSQNAKRRISKTYRRDSEVIYPPVDVGDAYIAESTEDYYLVVGQLAAYKRVDLAIEACNSLGRELRIVGVGEEYKRLKRLAGPNVSFLGGLSDVELRAQYAHCRALLFPGQEDFGIVPVEAQAFGRPLIAFGKGGALETVIGVCDGELVVPEQATGVFFREQSAMSLAQAIISFEKMEQRFSPNFIRTHAGQFDKQHFLDNMSQFIATALNDHRQQAEWSGDNLASLSASVG
jgi:glycosyltransferase involved in cell wall biosynthesis